MVIVGGAPHGFKWGSVLFYWNNITGFISLFNKKNVYCILNKMGLQTNLSNYNIFTASAVFWLISNPMLIYKKNEHINHGKAMIVDHYICCTSKKLFIAPVNTKKSTRKWDKIRTYTSIQNLSTAVRNSYIFRKSYSTWNGKKPSLWLSAPFIGEKAHSHDHETMLSQRLLIILKQSRSLSSVPVESRKYQNIVHETKPKLYTIQIFGVLIKN